MNPIENINRATIQGFIGRDSDFTKTTNGYSVLKFSVATKRLIRKKGGDSAEITEWHNVIAWGELADKWRDHTRKGAAIYLEGELQTSCWNDKKHGDKRYKTEIVAKIIERVDFRTGSADGQPQPQQPEQSAPQVVADDDLPF